MPKGPVWIPVISLESATRTMSSISVIVEVSVVIPTPSTWFTLPIAPKPPVRLLSNTNLSPTL